MWYISRFGHAIMVIGYVSQGALLFISLTSPYGVLFLPIVLMAPHVSKAVFGNCIFVIMANRVFESAKRPIYSTSLGWLASVISKKYVIWVHYGALVIGPAIAADVFLLLTHLAKGGST